MPGSRALGRLQTAKVLAILFECLYGLRNQLVHGGATWKQRHESHQVTDGARIMDVLAPIVIPNDLLIAAHYRASGITVVTGNDGELRAHRRVRVENWLQEISS